MAIEKPAEMQGAAFEAGLVERILDDVGEKPGNLPLLEFTLTLLWERQTDGWLTHTDYEAMGSVEGALAAYADQVYAELDAGGAGAAAADPGAAGAARGGDGRHAAGADAGGAGGRELEADPAPGRPAAGGDRAGYARARDGGGGARGADPDAGGASGSGWTPIAPSAPGRSGCAATCASGRRAGRDEGALLAGAPLVGGAELAGRARGRPERRPRREYIQASAALQASEQKERQRRRQWTIVGLAAGLVIALALAAFALFPAPGCRAQRQTASGHSAGRAGRDRAGERLSRPRRAAGAGRARELSLYPAGRARPGAGRFLQPRRAAVYQPTRAP